MLRALSLAIQKCIPMSVYSLIVLVLITAIMIFIGGLRRAFGVMVSALHQSFNESSFFELNMVGDTYSTLGYVLMPFLSSLICYTNDRFQEAMFLSGIVIMLSSVFTSVINTPGMMYVTFTFIHGVGSGTCLACVSLVVGRYFPRTHPHHVLATSLASASSYGIIVLTPLVAHLIQTYGWRISFVIFGGIIWGICLLSSVFFYPKSDSYDNVDSSGQKYTVPKWKFCSWQHLMENKSGLFWLIDRCLSGSIMFAVSMNLTEFRRKITNYDMEDSSVINIMLGVGECVTFTSTLFLGDRFRGRLTLSSLLGAVLCFLSVFAVVFSVHNSKVVLALTVIIGMSLGLTNSVLYAASSEAMNVDGTISLPLSKMTGAIGTFVSPFFSGMIIDLYGYEALFVSLIILTGIRCVLMSTVNVLLYRKRIRLQEIEDQEKLNNQEFAVNLDADSVKLEEFPEFNDNADNTLDDYVVKVE